MVIDSTSSNKIKENKYKILRMSLLLGSGEDKDEIVNNFEDAARDIDAMNDEAYIKEVENKFYDTLTLEEEEKKLSVLVDYIGGRAEQRISLINDFSNVTGFELSNLPPIKYYDKLDEYKSRLKYIREYLDNTKKIDILNKEVAELESKLEKTYDKKDRSEERNKNDEKLLLDKFRIIINKYLDFKDVDVNNIDDMISSINSCVNESKKSLDIFNKSFSTLENAGISYEEEQEYLSYVNSAKDSYYKNKEQEYLLTIYKLLISNECEYSKIILKRDTINNILYERLNLRKELEIGDNDILSDIYDLLDKQYKNITNQKEDIDNIDILSRDINTKRDTIKELELDNQKVEILALLKEFCIIDTYDEIDNGTVSNNTSQYNIENSININDLKKDDNNTSEQINDVLLSNNTLSLNENSDIFGSNSDEGLTQVNNSVEVLKETLDNKEQVLDNQVISVKDGVNIDLDTVINKANNVMKRVGKMLGVPIADDEKIVSVEDKSISENNDQQLVKEDIVKTVEDNTKESSQDVVIPVDSNNLFFNNDMDISKDSDNSISDNDNFWDSSFDDGGLSSLPDLPVTNDSTSDNFFNNNANFKFDFNTSDTEGK